MGDMKDGKAGIAALVIIGIAVAVLVLVNGGSAGKTAGSNSTNSTVPVVFANSNLAPYSYLVSGDNLSASAQAALAGYTLKRIAEPDGSVNMTIGVQGGGAPQNITIQQGYKLYIVETAFSDDSSAYDSSFADDGFVLVNPNGYIVA